MYELNQDVILHLDESIPVIMASLFLPISVKINEEGEENELSNLIQVEESGVIDKIVELRERLNERLRAEIKTGSFLQID